MERYCLTPLGQRMAAENIGLPYYLVGRYPARRKGTDPDGRLSSAILGLVRAVACYDPGCGVKFATYASRSILQEMARAEREDRLIRVPHYLFTAAETRYAAEAARALAVISIHREGRSARACKPGVQIVDYRRTEDEIAEDERRRDEDLDRLRSLVDAMPDRLRETMSLFARGLNQTEIARELGITKEAVRQRIRRAEGMLLRGMKRAEHTPATWQGSPTGRPS